MKSRDYLSVRKKKFNEYHSLKCKDKYKYMRDNILFLFTSPDSSINVATITQYPNILLPNGALTYSYGCSAVVGFGFVTASTAIPIPYVMSFKLSFSTTNAATYLTYVGIKDNTASVFGADHKNPGAGNGNLVDIGRATVNYSPNNTNVNAINNAGTVTNSLVFGQTSTPDAIYSIRELTPGNVEYNIYDVPNGFTSKTFTSFATTLNGFNRFVWFGVGCNTAGGTLVSTATMVATPV